MSEKDKERLSLSMYNAVLGVRDTISLPTHKTLEKTFYFSIALLGSSILSTVIGFYTFLSWQGCLLCVALLTILLFIERSENDALLKMYRNARLSTQKVVRRAKNVSASVSSKRSANTDNQHAGNASGRKRQSAQQPDKRRSSGDNGSPKSGRNSVPNRKHENSAHKRSN